MAINDKNWIKDVFKDYLDEYDLYKFAADMNALPPKDRLKAVNDMIG